MQADPIIAIATAPARGGIGIIRMSFPQASLPSPDALNRFAAAAFGGLPKPRFAQLSQLHDHDGSSLDSGLLLYFSAPASFTAEHVLEFQGHGGPALLQLCVQRLLTLGRPLGLRVAHAGEFTQRAFLNGKLDLAQAEAVADLIDAGSSRTARAAVASLHGEFSRRVDGLAQTLVNLRLLVEATLDFPEEEIDFLQQSDALGRLSRCTGSLDELLNQSRRSARAASGFRIVIAGQPNAGKSSLLNALTGTDRAIVTPVAGTTRDVIEQHIEIDGIAMTLIDTAGLRQTDDPVEQIGIARALAAVELADILLVLMDGSLSEPNAPAQLSGLIPQTPRLYVINKMDLTDSGMPVWKMPDQSVCVSAKTGYGLEGLKRRIFEILQCEPERDMPFLARQRHVDALLRCQSHLAQAHLRAQAGDQQLDLFAEELRLAHDALGEITGRVLPDDLLGLIFSRFCIGK